MATSFFNLAALNGSNGFIVNGPAAKYDLGRSVSKAGDVNGDGIDDVIIGADCTGNGESIAQPGYSYVLFGTSSGFPANFSLSTLNGSNGFVIKGIAADDSTGCSVSSIGDVNNDGLDDLIIGARFSDAKGNNSGRTYVVYGQQGSFPKTLELSSLNGSNGFVINGITADDRFGRAVNTASDVNNDGIEDFIIGARLANPDDKRNAGQSYVVFGKQGGFSASFDIASLNGSNGFAIDGINNGDDLGFSVASTGDLNGDGFSDVVIGALGADPNSKQNAGQSYVIFGKSGGFPARVNLSALNGSDGFRINGLAAGDNLGHSVNRAGDINGDGLDDLIVGSPEADSNGNLSTGRSYVIFGQRSGFAAQFDLTTLNGSNGFSINGLAAGDLLGSDVSEVGDINNDGIDDFAIGAPGANVDGKNDAGQVYLIFGRRSGFSATLDLANLNENEGLIFNGIVAEDEIGRAISAAGDVNNDGIDDLIIGAYTAEPAGFHSGQVYVVYGGPTLKGNLASNGLKLVPPLIDASAVTSGSITVNLATNSLTINAAQPSQQTVTGFTDVIGTALNDQITGNDNANILNGNEGNDRLLGGGKRDVLQGGLGNDILAGNADKDQVTGNEGNDRFLFDIGVRFNRKRMGVDSITDFTRKQDKIVLDRTTFRSLKRGKLTSFEQVRSVAQAKRSDAQIVYIRKTGSIFYNPNQEATGFGAGGLFTDIRNGINLAAKDFTVQA